MRLFFNTRINMRKKEAISEENLYRTSDMPLASFIALFEPLWAIDRGADSQRADFVFRREAGLDELIRGFWDGSLTVPPRAYFASLKAIKSRLYGE